MLDPNGMAQPMRGVPPAEGLMAMRRSALVVLLFVLAAVTIPAGLGLARQPAAAPAAVDVRADFNNDGADDLAVGVPFETVGGSRSAGAVNVLYGSAGGLTGTGSQLLTQDTPGVPGAVEVDDSFGFAVASGDFDNDGFADLAVGADLEAVGSTADAGAVNVLYGSAAGLTGTGSQLFTQVGSAVEDGDRFGYALAAGDFDNNGFADLAVGTPFEDVGSTVNAGAISVLPGSAGGLTATGGRLFTQVGSAPEPADLFGAALAAGDFDNNGVADLAVGAPFESVGAANPAAGAVSVLPGSAGGLTATGGRLFTQVGSAPEPDDLFGDALAAGDFDNNGVADLAAGAPGESVGASLPAAGAVSELPGSAGGLTATGGRLFTQVGGTVEAGDVFGNGLAAADFDNDGFADLAAGAPGEDVGSVVDAGAVSELPGSAGGLTATGGRLFTQVGGTVEREDFFGSALAAGDFDNNGFADVAAGALFEDIGSAVDAGAVSVLPGSAGGLTATGGRLFTQDSPGVEGSAETRDHFGAALAVGDPSP
jgi:FG-GAP repeat